MAGITGQCHTDPVTGIAGAIYTAWTGAVDAGLASAATTAGSDTRNLLAAQIESVAASISSSSGLVHAVVGGTTYTVDDGVTLVSCDTSNGSIINLLLPNFAAGTPITVYDAGGNAAVKVINISASLGTIRKPAGTTATPLNVAYGSKQFISLGSGNWLLVGSFG